MKQPFQIRVECYAGYKADERPVRFYFGQRSVEVAEIEDRWYGPGCSYFRVRAVDGNLYVLKHTEDAQQDRWTLESFRRP